MFFNLSLRNYFQWRVEPLEFLLCLCLTSNGPFFCTACAWICRYCEIMNALAMPCFQNDIVYVAFFHIFYLLLFKNNPLFCSSFWNVEMVKRSCLGLKTYLWLFSVSHAAIHSFIPVTILNTSCGHTFLHALDYFPSFPWLFPVLCTAMCFFILLFTGKIIFFHQWWSRLYMCNHILKAGWHCITLVKQHYSFP